MAYVGIDPGVNGAIAVLEKDELCLYRFPTIKVENKKGRKMSRLDLVLLADVFNLIRDNHSVSRIMIEEPILLPNQHVASTFYNGVSHGALLALCAATFGVTPDSVKCRDWQDALIAKRTPVNSKHRRDHRKQLKLDSIAEAKKRFPGVDFRKSKKSKIDHDGCADAALIALYSSL